MKINTILIFLSTVAPASELSFTNISQPMSVETYVFGKSHHTNRKVDWNENNYGMGLGIAYTMPTDYGQKIVDFTLIGGTYKDSYNESARFFMPGIRLNYGKRNDLHWNIGFNVGYFEGSGCRGTGMLPSLGIGWNRFDICLTGSIPTIGDKRNPNGSRNPEDNRNTSSGFIATFLRIKVASW
jgi:hypothetical protein